MAEVQVKKISWWMERLADWMLANPEKRLKDAAKEFQVTQAWLSVVKNSDVFKELFAQRSAELSSQVIDGVRDKLVGMTEIALDHLNNKLEREAEFMPLPDLLKVVDMGLDKLGYGASKNSMPPPVSIAAQNVLITSGDLAAARQKVMEATGATQQINQEVKLLESVDAA